MRVACAADLHGHLPVIPAGVHIVLLGGDLAPFGNNSMQLGWLNTAFREWLEDLHTRGIHVVGIPGNHDSLFEDVPQLVPDLPWVHLQDQSCILNNGSELHVWGTPWSNQYGDWSFMGEEPFLKTRYDLIPSNVDVIVSHGPPHGYGDACPQHAAGDRWENVGSRVLLDAVERVRPKLVVYGHIHQGYGVYRHGDTTLCNAALWDHTTDTYRTPIVLDVD